MKKNNRNKRPLDFLTPRIVVSKCLGFDHCRYNGLTINSEVVNQLKKYAQFLTVCPEVEIELGVPRDPIRLVTANGELRLIQPATGLDVTEKMNSFSDNFLKSLSGIDGFVLKNRFPSCGISDTKIFPKSEQASLLKKGTGLFGAKVLEMFPHFPIEDEGRLTNFRLRKHFFIRIFTNARFRQIKKSNAMKNLVGFHSQNKLLLMGYNQKEMRLMGRIVANQDKLQVQEVLQNYEQHLFSVFIRPARLASNINVLLHAFGYFSKQLTHQEKAFFLDSLEDYRKKKVPLSVPLALIKS